MKKILYAFLTLCITCIAVADDHIIQFVLSNGQHVSFRTSDVQSITYDYHNQDSIDQAYADSVRNAFVRDSLYQDSLRKDQLMRDSIANCHTLNYMIDSVSECRIFAQAMKLTGLADSVARRKKDATYTISDYWDTTGWELYHPNECRLMYTIFAETDSVMRANGINTIDDLIAYANAAYAKASEWYDYLSENGITVSTGTDYTNRFNALNMFVAYHILYAGMPEDELVYERNAKWQKAQTWNYVNGAQPFDYYETMLPSTLMKIWQPDPLKNKKSLFINRYVANNTLTDEVGSTGSISMHDLVSPGVKINRSSDKADDVSEWNIQASNGYIHTLQGMLVYNSQVPKGVLFERMRIDATTFLPELINNGFRMATYTEMSAIMNGGGSATRVAFPLDYFDDVVSYTSDNRFRYNVKGAYNAWQSDVFQGWGLYDLAIKMPPVPTGEYEIRVMYIPMSHSGTIEYSIGSIDHAANKRPTDANDITYDVLKTYDLTIPMDDPRIGWTNYLEESDLGVASDKVMRDNGFMRGPYSYKDHPEYGDENNYSMRQGTRNGCLRAILGRKTLNQNKDYWLRLKALDYKATDLKYSVDYIELVPIGVVDNTQYSEDWY
jgi:hypothetical protein